jgi:ADP-heptose:LPS heptosyltransferase
MSKAPHPKSVKKIAVLRAGVLGDFLIATPALKTLSMAFKGAETTLLARPSMVEFIKDRYPYIHQVRAIPFSPGILNYPDQHEGLDSDKFFKEMQKEDFDLAIQMHGGGKYSNPFVKKLGAKLTLGTTAPEVKDYLDLNLRYEFYQNEIFRTLEILSLIGVKPSQFQTEAFVKESDREELASVLEKLKLSLTKYVVIHPGAHDPRRHWPAENFAFVAAQLHREYGGKTVLIGTKDEEILGKEVAAKMSTPVINLTGKTSLGALTALISQASLVIGNDSGPSHLAVALDVPTVTVFWIGNTITWAPFFRRIHRPAISWQTNCPRCHRGNCGHKVSFVEDVSPEEVLDQARNLLRESSLAG